MLRVRRWLERAARKRRAERVLRREVEGLDPKYGRLIVVCGMARTGTSATAAYIGSHPDVNLLVGGGLWYVAETDVMKGDIDWNTIDGILRDNPLERLVVKQPWLEANASFFEKAKGAKVVVCRRSLDKLNYSWIKTEMVERECKHYPEAVYNRHEAYAKYLTMLGALEVWPEREGAGICIPLAEHLGLYHSGFDWSRMERRWLNKSEKPWLELNAMWEEEI